MSLNPYDYFNKSEYDIYNDVLMKDTLDISKDKRYTHEISLERGPQSLFRLRNLTWKKAFIPKKFIDLSTVQLPFNSILHILDNLQEEVFQDTIRLSNHPLIANEEGRKVLYNCVLPNNKGIVPFVEPKYIYRTSGLTKNLLSFRMEHSKTIRTVAKLDQIPLTKEVLIVINHNPLFRMRYFGVMLFEFRRITNLLAHVLNTTLLLPDERMQFILIDMNKEYYFKTHFLRTANILSRSTVRINSRHFTIMMHFINFVRYAATTSIFSKYPKDHWSKINLIFAYKKYGFIYNLQDLYDINKEDMMLLRIINHFNLLILTQEKNVDLNILESQAEQEFNEDTNKSIEIVDITTKANTIDLIPSTSEEYHDKKQLSEDKIKIESEEDEKTDQQIQSMVKNITNKPSSSLLNVVKTVLTDKEDLIDKKVLKSIKFIKNEIDPIKINLFKNNEINTIRIPIEKDKYDLEDLVIPDFDKTLILKVIEKNEYKNINQYPLYQELTDEQIALIHKYKSFIVLKLKLIKGKVKLTQTQLESVKSSQSVTTVPKKEANKKLEETQIAEKDTDTFIIQRSNLTKVYDKTDPQLVQQRGKELINHIDKSADSIINFYPDLTSAQIERFKKLSKTYKTIKINDKGTTVEQLLTTPISTKVNKHTLNKDQFKDLVEDESLLSSSIYKFDQEYMEKQFEKDLYSTLVSFNANGLFIQDIKTKETIDPLSHMVEYAVKLDDINGKSSTLHFSIPKISKDGDCFLNGVKQRMKKQMIALPIYQISPTRVSLASSFNKHLVERNTYRANSYNYFIIKLIEDINKANPNSVKVTYGKNIITNTVGFDYSVLAKLFTFIEFPLGTINPNNAFGFKLYFDYNNREADWTNQFKTESLSKFELDYGVYCGYLTFANNTALFLDIDNHLRLIDVANKTVIKNTTITSLIHETYFPNVKPRQIFEYVDLKILDKKFPVIFVLGFQYGLRNILDYLEIDYKLIPKKAKIELDQDELSQSSPEQNKENKLLNLDKVQYLNEIDALGLKPNEYVILGSSVLVLFDILNENKDLDLVISDHAFKRLQSQDKIVTTKNKNYVIRDSHIDLGSDNDSTFIFKEWIDNSIRVGQYRFANLYILKKLYEKLVVDNANDSQKVTKYSKRIALINTYNKTFDTTSSTESFENLHISMEKNPNIVDSYKLKPDDLLIKFKDYNLVFNRYPLVHSLIVSGLSYFQTETFTLEEFDTKDIYYNLLLNKSISINYLKGITGFFNFFIDPITRDILEQMNEPTDIKGLLIRATQLLSTEDFREPASSQNYRIRSYERIPAILYNEISRQLSTHVNTRSRKVGFTINPKSIYQRILQDQAMVQVDDLNPIKSLKELTAFTYSGQGGRSQQSFVLEDRKYPNDGIGVISENTPTSQNVAMVASTPLNPVMFNTRGFLDIPEHAETLEPSEYLDPVSLLIPSLLNDDTKRANMVAIQSQHIMPCEKYEVGRCRTGFEAVLAHRTSSIFASVAEQDGTVADIDTKLNLMTIRYKDNSTDVIDFSTKYSESAGTNITQKLILNNAYAKIGSKFTKDTILAYNPDYFEQDGNVPSQVNWKIGVFGNVALCEVDGTLDDACIISSQLSKKLSILPVHKRAISLAPNTQIFRVASVGTHIQSIDPIMSFEEIDFDANNYNVSEAELELFEKLDRKLPKAGYTGTIVDIEIFYNVNPSEMHPSLRELVKTLNKTKELKHNKSKGTKSSLDFLPPMQLPVTTKFKNISFKSPTVAIVFYIQDEYGAEVGDKIIFGTSLKSVVSSILSDPITTESGTTVDALFSSEGIFNRIVTSPFIIGCTERIMEKLENNILDIYFK
jgi:hypothetical protein